MKVLSLDNDGDWTFGQGLSNYATFNQAIAQCIQTRISSFLGDCFFDVAAGIDWFNYLGSKKTLQLDLSLSTVILNTFGVVTLNELSLRISGARNLVITYKATTIYPGIIKTAIGLLMDEDGNILTTEAGEQIHG